MIRSGAKLTGWSVAKAVTAPGKAVVNAGKGVANAGKETWRNVGISAGRLGGRMMTAPYRR